VIRGAERDTGAGVSMASYHTSITLYSCISAGQYGVTVRVRSDFSNSLLLPAGYQIFVFNAELNFEFSLQSKFMCIVLFSE
jgi:hypothetical protein